MTVPVVRDESSLCLPRSKALPLVLTDFRVRQTHFFSSFALYQNHTEACCCDVWFWQWFLQNSHFRNCTFEQKINSFFSTLDELARIIFRASFKSKNIMHAVSIAYLEYRKMKRKERRKTNLMKNELLYEPSFERTYIRVFRSGRL